jgi:hypothetical protein
MDAHHRQQRSVGGKDLVENLVGVHRRCHDKIHQASDLMIKNGWLLSSWQQPATTPIRMWDGWRFLSPTSSGLLFPSPPGVGDLP